MSTKKKKKVASRGKVVAALKSAPKRKTAKSVRAPRPSRKKVPPSENIVRLKTSSFDWMVGRSTQRGISIKSINIVRKPSKGALNEYFEALTADGKSKHYFSIDATQPGGVSSKVLIPAKDVVGLTVSGKEYQVASDTSYNHRR